MTAKQKLKDFYKLSYKDRLEYWERNYIDKNYSIYKLIEHKGKDMYEIELQGKLREYYISIQPIDKEEMEVFADWVIKVIVKKGKTFEKLKEEIINKFNKSPLPEKYIEEQLKILKKEKDKYYLIEENPSTYHKRFFSLYRYFCNGYEAAVNAVELVSVIKQYNVNSIFNAQTVYKGFLNAKLEGFLNDLLNGKEVTIQKTYNEKKKKYSAKYHVLAYLFECDAKGYTYPIGNKKELERIGKERMSLDSGNTFYKQFNQLVNIDRNIERNLINRIGEDWRNAVIELSTEPILIEEYLQRKQL